MSVTNISAGLRGAVLAAALAVLPQVTLHTPHHVNDHGHLLAQTVPPYCDPTDPNGGCYDPNEIHRG
jgi:hypothetical protein